MLGADYFGTLATVVGERVTKGSVPAILSFRGGQAALPPVALVTAVLAAADGLRERGLAFDWRLSVAPGAGLQQGTISAPGLPEDRADTVLRAIADGTGGVGELIQVYSHATQAVAEADCLPTGGASGRATERARGRAAVALLALRRVFGDRLVSRATLPSPGDEVQDLCNADFRGIVANVVWNAQSRVHMIGVRLPVGEGVMTDDESIVILRSATLPAVEPVFPEED